MRAPSIKETESKMRQARMGILLGVATLAAMWSPAMLADEWSSVVKISSVFFNASSNEFIVTPATKMVLPSCPTASAAYVPTSLQYRQQMIDMLIAAHASGRSVSFYGACAPLNPALFNVKMIDVR